MTLPHLRGLLGLALTLLPAAKAAAAAPGFPPDFPALVASGGPAAGSRLTGFGGVPGLGRDAQRARVHHRPVILLHGNGASVDHAVWGVTTLAANLRAAGYDDAEIWAVSYLGDGNALADMTAPYSGNIDDVRRFVDAVRDYLGVDKVDLVGHSLGAGLAKAYVTGLGTDGADHRELGRFDQVGTVVALSGAFYGLGPFSVGEFRTGSPFEVAGHELDGIVDDTPHGSSQVDRQRGPYKNVTALDDDRVTYVALWCDLDFIDAQNPGTGHLDGADLNQSFELGWGLLGHAAMLTSPAVFTALLPYLDGHRPGRAP